MDFLQVKIWELAMKSQLYRWANRGSVNPEYRNSGRFVDYDDYLKLHQAFVNATQDKESL